LSSILNDTNRVHTSVIYIASGLPSSGKRYIVTPRLLRLQLHFLPRSASGVSFCHTQSINLAYRWSFLHRGDISISCSVVIVRGTSTWMKMSRFVERFN